MGQTVAPQSETCCLLGSPLASWKPRDVPRWTPTPGRFRVPAPALGPPAPALGPPTPPPRRPPRPRLLPAGAAAQVPRPAPSWRTPPPRRPGPSCRARRPARGNCRLGGDSSRRPPGRFLSSSALGGRGVSRRGGGKKRTVRSEGFPLPPGPESRLSCCWRLVSRGLRKTHQEPKMPKPVSHPVSGLGRTFGFYFRAQLPGVGGWFPGTALCRARFCFKPTRGQE